MAVTMAATISLYPATLDEPRSMVAAIDHMRANNTSLFSVADAPWSLCNDILSIVRNNLQQKPYMWYAAKRKEARCGVGMHKYCEFGLQWRYYADAFPRSDVTTVPGPRIDDKRTMWVRSQYLGHSLTFAIDLLMVNNGGCAVNLSTDDGGFMYKDASDHMTMPYINVRI